ncbi:MAG: glycoside hydrolase family 97 protein [Sphingopyxis sp.]
MIVSARNLFRFIALSLAALMFTPASAQRSVSAASPDGSIGLTVAVNGEGRPSYSISRNGVVLLSPSRLGFLFTDALAFDRGLVIESHSETSTDARWEQPWGERRFVRDHHNELLVVLRENSDAHRRIAVRFRLFDDGVGFRYEFLDQSGWGTVHIQDELTEFNIAPRGLAWWITGGDWNRYEQIYQRTEIDAVSTAHTPITMRLDDGTHLAFHEAALVDYAGMWLRRVDGQRFKATLSPSSTAARVTRLAPFTTPWRSIRIAGNAAGLVESDLELNLNEPNRLGDVSWVRPYKYIGIWWDMHLDNWSWASGARHGATTENTRRYIDFAAAHGFRGVLVEGWNVGWDGNWFGHGDEYSFTRPYLDFDIEGLAAYGRARGVRLIGHHETGGNIANYESQLDGAMALYQRLGIDSVKTGYVADAGGIISRNAAGALAMEWHDGQVMSRHHLNVVETAARHHVMVNPHEPIKDTGLRRTYPNWVAREGARGMEYDAWGEPGNDVDHIPTLVYTRMLSGPMDYTPGVLSLQGRGGRPISSTLARQLALYLTIYSPIQMAADRIENLERFPRELAFISAVPTDWEDSWLIDGAVGDYALFRRKDRNSADWYVGGVTDGDARDFDVALDFLPAGHRYRMTIYADGPDADYRTVNRGQIVIEERIVTAASRVALHMAPGGGVAVRLTPASQTRTRR